MEIILDLSINYSDEDFDIILDEKKIEDYVKHILIEEEIESEKPLYISIMFTDNSEIQLINKEHRDKDAPTDVISFAYHETDDFDIGPYDTLGDIVISLERVKDQASDYGHSLEREFYYVLTHGVLHILGYDHIDEEDKVIMREREENILNKFGYKRELV